MFCSFDPLGLIFAHFPSKPCHPSSAGSTGTQSGLSSEEGEQTPEIAENLPQTTATNSYSELGDGQVMEILTKHLAGYSAMQQQIEESSEPVFSQNLDLVLFKGAIEHASRLCRILVSTS